MTGLALEIKDFLNLAQTLPVMDVRTPAEYDHAHIPGAENIPVFSNEERSVIGTLYLKKSSSEAILRGLDFIRPKLNSFAETGYRIARDGEALMHCWRGGMRSNSMAWLMNTIGIKTYTLSGGYKSYRRYTSEYFGRSFNLIVIGGRTGSGKTEVIKELKQLRAQVIDLEGIANHKGSVFGSIGLPEQPSNEQFENNLFAELVKLDAAKPIFIEDESLAIGKVFIPRNFFDQMSSSAFIRLDIPFESRLKNLLKIYGTGSTDELVDAVTRLVRRLGYGNTAAAIRLIASGDLPAAAEIVLRYYDKIYDRSMNNHTRKYIYVIGSTTESSREIALQIISKAKKWN